MGDKGYPRIGVCNVELRFVRRCEGGKLKGVPAQTSEKKVLVGERYWVCTSFVQRRKTLLVINTTLITSVYLALTYYVPGPYTWYSPGIIRFNSIR